MRRNNGCLLRNGIGKLHSFVPVMLASPGERQCTLGLLSDGLRIDPKKKEFGGSEAAQFASHRQVDEVINVATEVMLALASGNGHRLCGCQESQLG